jgi:hypothetical protein
LLEEAVKGEGARLTISPELRGPMSKGELQVFYAGSRNSTPAQVTFNSPWKQIRTVEFQVYLMLKDLREPNAAIPLLEAVKGLLTGAQVFGLNDTMTYGGGLYPVADRFRRLDDQAFWYYELTLACQIEDSLPLPYVPALEVLPIP